MCKLSSVIYHISLIRTRMKSLSFGLLLVYINYVFCYSMEGFDDTVLYDINWLSDKNDKLELEGAEYIIATSTLKEKYKCIIPQIQEKEPNVSSNYDGPTPLELISPLFTQTACSYRLESYWTYEVCHGRFIRQYHEDREGKKVKIQEYTLGRWEKNHYTMMEQLKNSEIDKVPVKKVDGVSLPYFEVTMGNGTLCELNQNKPRETKILYVCYVHGKHEIYSLKETSTCVYEVIILSPLLCVHPKYKPQESGEHTINCMALDDAPYKPRELLKMKAENNKFRRKADMDRIRVEFHPIDLNKKEENVSPAKNPADVSPVEDFLAGKKCLNGGTGWWNYEFCYGKSVEQYHIHKDGSRISIKLGFFDKSKHLQWLSLHPHKKPKSVGQRVLSHFYSGGDVCDKTGKPRQTEVKLKCLQNAKPSAVSLYLLEPKYCEYILGVESPLICKILDLADENGLVENVTDNDIDEGSNINVITV